MTRVIDLYRWLFDNRPTDRTRNAYEAGAYNRLRGRARGAVTYSRPHEVAVEHEGYDDMDRLLSGCGVRCFHCGRVTPPQSVVTAVEPVSVRGRGCAP